MPNFIRPCLVALLSASIVAACEDRHVHGPDPDDAIVDEDHDGAPASKPEPAVACPGEVQSRECRTGAGAEGLEVCVLVDGEPVWTTCEAVEDVACMPGDNYDMGCLGSTCVFDGERLEYVSWQTDPECATPLVLQFEAAPLRFEPSPAAASFDFAAGGGCHTDWPSAPWLALDRDRDGAIDSGRELFGSGTRLRSGARASHGFEALAELDADGDRRITPADPMFAELVLWRDADADRSGALTELTAAGDAGLVAIHLDFARAGECDARGNCGLERAAFEFRAADGSLKIGEVVDVYLACQ